MTKKPIYPRGTVAKAIHKAIHAYPTLSFTLDDIYAVVRAELTFVKRRTVFNQIAWSLKRQGFIEATSTKGVYKVTPAFALKMKAGGVRSLTIKPEPPKGKAEPQELGHEIVSGKEDAWFTSAQIGKHVVEYVNSLKSQIADLEGELFTLTKQINKLQEAYNESKINGGLTVEEIMKRR